MQLHPSAFANWVVIADLQGADAAEGEQQHADQRPIAQPIRLPVSIAASSALASFQSGMWVLPVAMLCFGPPR